MPFEKAFPSSENEIWSILLKYQEIDLKNTNIHWQNWKSYIATF